MGLASALALATLGLVLALATMGLVLLGLASRLVVVMSHFILRQEIIFLHTRMGLCREIPVHGTR